MLRGILGALTAHLEPGGEGWLILSDFADGSGGAGAVVAAGAPRRRLARSYG